MPMMGAVFVIQRKVPSGASRRFSDALEVALPLPIRHRAIERFLLGADEMQVVLDDVLAEDRTRELALAEQIGGLAQRWGHARDVVRRVHVARERPIGDRKSVV